MIEEKDEKSFENREEISEEKVDSQPEEGGKEEQEQEFEETELDLSRLRGEIESLIDEKESYYKQLLRLQADFDNYRKRITREKEKIAFNTKVSLFNDLLPVIDNFERALGSFENDDEFTKGVEMIYRQLLKFLDNNGIKVIPTEGEYFDHNLHEAVMQVEDSEVESGVIIEELQKGYMLDDRVIRPAMVKVAS